jgi:hypothetical protein
MIIYTYQVPRKINFVFFYVVMREKEFNSEYVIYILKNNGKRTMQQLKIIRFET